jgi:serine/threonine-protein kinase
VKEEPGVIERFEREARAAGQLLSANVARVLDVATSSTGLPYIVMEFLEGRDLQDELETKKQLPIDEAVDYVLQACSAMREAHSLGIIHRDLKPANLFLCPSAAGPVIKILDFGISKITTEVDGRLTAAMTTLGSPVYMSPEQLRGASEVDPRTDIWSLGVVLYELLAGRPPYSGTLTSVTAAIIADAPPRLASYRDDVPAELEAAIGKALQKSPGLRFEDAEAFAAALVPFASAASAKWLQTRLSLAPSALSSRRLGPPAPPKDDDSLTMMGPPVSAPGRALGAGAPPSGSETRHAMTRRAFEGAVRATPRSRTLMIAGVFAVFAAGIGVLVFARSAARPAVASDHAPLAASVASVASVMPVASVGPVVSVASPAPSAAPAIATTATASADSAPSAHASSAHAGVARPPPASPPPAPRAHPAPAATNPLRL